MEWGVYDPDYPYGSPWDSADTQLEAMELARKYAICGKVWES
ncbi:hypothetical protein PBI_NEBKISS_80 [Mycobacterium phage Nebkiss]|nr:hypothetical protein PBI_NEBKISS_80 [Mycobacterium phage Nebkiss]